MTPNDRYRGLTAPLTSKVEYYIFIQQIWVQNILNMVYTLRFFSPKCSLFHNSNVFSSCIIHILYTECAKIKKKFRHQKVNPLTPNDRYRCRTAPLTSKVSFYIFIQQILVPNILNMLYNLRFIFSSKCSLFHNSNVFGSCIIHISFTGVLKLRK